MASNLFRDPLYTQQYDTAMGLLDVDSPQRKAAMKVAQGEVAGRYAKAGLTGSGQELQAVQDTARDLTFNQSVQAMNAAQLPVSNWLAADTLRRAQKTGDIQLMGQALAALGIPQYAAKSLFGIDTTPKYIFGGPEAVTTKEPGWVPQQLKDIKDAVAKLVAGGTTTPSIAGGDLAGITPSAFYPYSTYGGGESFGGLAPVDLAGAGAGAADIGAGLVPAADFWGQSAPDMAEMLGLIGW